MKILQWTLAVTLIAGTVAAPEARAQDEERMVFVRGREGGRGIIRKGGNQCFIVAPDHVVRGDIVRNPDYQTAPDTTWVVLSGGHPIPTTYATTLPQDLTILRVARGNSHAPDLCATWPRRVWSIGNLRRSLESGTPQRGVLLGRDQSGVGTSMPVELTKVDEAGGRFTVTPVQSWDRIEPGMSGSLVYVNERPAGILLAVTDSKQAVIHSLERLEADLGPNIEIRSRVRPSSLAIMSSIVVPGTGQYLTGRPKRSVLWASTAAAAVIVARQQHRTVTETRTFVDGLGIPRDYPYRVREYPYRDFVSGAALWMLFGAFSAAEAAWYVHDKYPQSGESLSDQTHNMSLRIIPRATGAEGALGVALSVEFSF